MTSLAVYPTSCVAPAVRRESGVEECGNTFGYTGTR